MEADVALEEDAYVVAFNVRTGNALWTTALSGMPAGASIESVRAWPGVVTAGVSLPRPLRGRAARTEVVLSARTGVSVRAYPAAEFGGAVAASSAATVIIGSKSVTSYANKTGKVRSPSRLAATWAPRRSRHCGRSACGPARSG